MSLTATRAGLFIAEEIGKNEFVGGVSCLVWESTSDYSIF